jgi:hypothetical protein
MRTFDNLFVDKAYRAWVGLRNRCNDHTNEHYGSRGISYTPYWNSFDHFLADMGVPPTLMHQLDRRDSNGSYTKTNCRWVIVLVQRLNTRVYKNNRLQVKGVRPCSYGRRFEARGTLNKQTVVLYSGADFFEAVCARKSWECRNGT